MASGPEAPLIVGRYALYDKIAGGGMATVHVGRLLGTAGFTRTVAIKRLHQRYAQDPEFVSMFIDEARIAARIQHGNVFPCKDPFIGSHYRRFVQSRTRDNLPVCGIAVKCFGQAVGFNGNVSSDRQAVCA